MITEPGLYNMDCMAALKEYPDNYFDLAIVDPPYGDAGGMYGTLQAASEKDRVHRTGGTWAEKFGKKS